jgi:bifunctional N-acetylglucosamine-1-phosphate-uridyltransferase/glucosamine-1-phosphate-acetyltransferase GlmU-like protein
VRGHAGWVGDDIAGGADASGAGHRRAEGRHRAERQIREVYSGIMAVPARQLKGWLARLDNRNAQGEYYLTDVVKFAVADGVPVVAHRIDDALQVAGINSPMQLAELERAFSGAWRAR